MLYSSLVRALFALLASLAFASQDAASHSIDPILRATSQLSCDHFKDRRKMRECIKKLSQTPRSKAGSCPAQGPPLTLACLKECTSDTDCPTTTKCCPHSCGITCKPPTDLNQVSGLPKVPRRVQVKGLPRKGSKSVIVKWKHDLLEDEEVLYVGEMREEGGAEVSRIGERWHPVRNRPTKYPKFKMILEPGLYYQFRIAAVNINGSRGFSKPSKPYKLTIMPKPPESPGDLNFTWHNTKNSSQLVGVLSWSPPKSSEIPITCYIVFVSQRIASELASPMQGSVIVRQRTVSHDRTSVQLNKLKPNQLYFLQVKAQSQYGKEKLVSDPANYTLNTTNISQNISSQHQRSEPVMKDFNLRVSKFKLSPIESPKGK